MMNESDRSSRSGVSKGTGAQVVRTKSTWLPGPSGVHMHHKETFHSGNLETLETLENVWIIRVTRHVHVELHMKGA